MVAWRSQILSSIKDITPDLILQFNHVQFHVTSQSHPGEYYTIDLQQPACDCADFPRIQFCKHIAAIYAHFPHLSPEGINTPVLTEDITPLSQPECASTQENNLQSLTQDIAALSQTLVSKSSSSAILEAARSAKYTLTVAISSIEGSNALPEKDFIVPNQKSWIETAKRMGVKCGTPKRKCPPAPKERRVTARSIGVAKGKRCQVHSDPYAGGKQSGKRAKPDATSAIANVRAHVCAAPPSATAPTPSMPTEMLVPPSATMPSTHPETQVALALTFPPQSMPAPMLPPYAVSLTKTCTCMDVPQ